MLCVKNRVRLVKEPNRIFIFIVKNRVPINTTKFIKSKQIGEIESIKDGVVCVDWLDDNTTSLVAQTEAERIFEVVK